MTEIILASGSPRRKKLLEQINLRFNIHPSNVDESFSPDLTPNEVVTELALRKMRDIAQHYSNALVIGADTIVTYENQILEKPENMKEARNMLESLSGDTHNVLTGVALGKTRSDNNIVDIHSFTEKTDVTFGNLHSEDIQSYVASGSPMDKAGGYGIQDDFGAIFVEKINGDYYNVVGFPVHRFYNALYDFAPDALAMISSPDK